MDARLSQYSDIITLIHRWDNESRDTNSAEISTLRQLDIDTISNAVLNIFSFGEDETRLSTIEVLRHVVPQSVMIELLIPCVADSRSSIRWTVCRLFEQYGDARVTLPMLEVLQGDDNPSVRVAAADALCAVGDERALPSLLHAAEHDHAQGFDERTVSQAAAEAAEQISARQNHH